MLVASMLQLVQVAVIAFYMCQPTIQCAKKFVKFAIVLLYIIVVVEVLVNKRIVVGAGH